MTITAAASAWDANLGSYVSGAAQSITFLPLAQTQPAATITNLSWSIRRTPPAAAHGDDPTVAGQVACDTGADGLTVQFGHFDSGNNWVADGTTTTDADGNFTYLPANLTAGSVNLYARVQQWDYSDCSPAGQYILGPVSDVLHLHAPAGRTAGDRQPSISSAIRARRRPTT